LKPCGWQEIKSSRLFHKILDDNNKRLGKDSNILSLFKEIFKDSKDSDFIYDNVF
jgi:hypothetical protein